MLSKLTSLFKPTATGNPQSLDDTFDHSKLSKDANPSECPFMKKKSSGQCPMGGSSNENKENMKSQNKADKKKNANVSDSESEEEKPRGGCPFMGGSEKKKNPPLTVISPAYTEPFISKFKYYLSPSKIDFMSNTKDIVFRHKFNTYPIYLQHTLFYKGEDFIKIRAMECCSRFMAYEQLREKGNKKYLKGKYYEALDYYERAMSLFRWLQYGDKPKQPQTLSEHSMIQSEQSIGQSSLGSQNDSKIHLGLQQESDDLNRNQNAPTANKKYDSEMQAFRNQYKQFFITYHDNNTTLHDGQELTETADLDMRKSLLIQIYLNMAAAYIKLAHFDLAEQTMKDAMELSEKVSQVYFRFAQVYMNKMDASLDELKKGKQMIQMAVQMRPNQKIFSSSNANILKMLNLQDAQQVYHSVNCKLQELIKEKQLKLSNLNDRLKNRMEEIHSIEMRMIKEGKTPREGADDTGLTEMKILQRMKVKYCKVIEFYTQGKNKEQVMLAKKEMQQILRVHAEINDLCSVQLVEHDNSMGGLQTDKIQKRLAHVKAGFAQEIYNAGKYNFTVMEWAIKEIVKEEREEKQLQEKKEKEEKERIRQAEGGAAEQTKKGWKDSMMYLLVLIPLLIVLISAFLF